MNKKGFVLMETIIVIVVISVALLTLFSSYNKILTKLKAENKYDTSEYIYMTKYVKKALINGDAKSIYDCSGTNPVNDLIDYANDVSGAINTYGVKHVYLLSNINDIDSGATNHERLLQFDAYMIDYIRKLDVDDDETLIIVEYEKHDITDSDVDLNKTYIASLEW